jgi:hypothetical protein
MTPDASLLLGNDESDGECGRSSFDAAKRTGSIVDDTLSIAAIGVLANVNSTFQLSG